MMAPAQPKLALRPYLPADAPLLAEIFRASIEELTADDYSAAQQEAWASAADDEEEFAQPACQRTDAGRDPRRLAGRLRLARGNDEIDMLYVHPAAAGQGVGSMLCDALEKLAGRARRGKAHRSTPATRARGFFEKRGYVAKKRNTVIARRRMARQHHHVEAARRKAERAMKRQDAVPAPWLYY